MKHFLSNCFLFICFSTAVYFSLTILIGTSAPKSLKNLNFKRGGSGYLHTRLRDVDTTKNVDVLFLGSSHAYRGYDTRIFKKAGYKTFNLGSSAQTPAQTEVLVNKYLDQLNPKTVIIDVYPVTFASDGVESALDLISNASMDLGIIKMAFATNNVKVVNTLIYGFIKQLIPGGEKFREPIVKGSSTYITGGYVETYQKFKPVAPVEKRHVSISNSQLEAFDRILDKLKAKKQKYLIVQAPITQRSYNSFENNSAIDILLHQKGTYYNFNKLLSLPDSVFFDDSHLNQRGVNVFNEKLLDILEKNT